jgi:hypothetical protein
VSLHNSKDTLTCCADNPSEFSCFQLLVCVSASSKSLQSTAFRFTLFPFSPMMAIQNPYRHTQRVRQILLKTYKENRTSFFPPWSTTIVHVLLRVAAEWWNTTRDALLLQSKSFSKEAGHVPRCLFRRPVVFAFNALHKLRRRLISATCLLLVIGSVFLVAVGAFKHCGAD